MLCTDSALKIKILHIIFFFATPMIKNITIQPWRSDGGGEVCSKGKESHQHWVPRQHRWCEHNSIFLKMMIVELWIPVDRDEDDYNSNPSGFHGNIIDVRTFLKMRMVDLLMIMMMTIMIGIIILLFPRFGRSLWGSTNALVSCWSNSDQVLHIAIIVAAVTMIISFW